MNILDKNDSFNEDLHKEYNRIEIAREIYERKKKETKKIYRKMVFILTVFYLIIISDSFYTWIPNNYKFYTGIILFMGLGSSIYFLRESNKSKKIENELSLTIEEEIYSESYDLWKNMSVIDNEKIFTRKAMISDQIRNGLNYLQRILDYWDYGTLSMVKKIIGNDFDEFKNAFLRLDIDRIDENYDYKNLMTVMYNICLIICEPSNQRLHELTNLIQNDSIYRDTVKIKEDPFMVKIIKNSDYQVLFTSFIVAISFFYVTRLQQIPLYQQIIVFFTALGGTSAILRPVIVKKENELKN